MTTRERNADLYVSPDGDDGWSGERAEPGEDDGPFRTIERAQRAVRERKADARIDGGLTVRLRGGTYRLDEPLTFEPEDSAPVTYAAYPGEEPVLSGGRAIDGWEATTVNGVDAWKATVPAVRDGDWYPRQLFVDGERRPRPRLPKGVNDVLRGDATAREGETPFYEVAGVSGEAPNYAFEYEGEDLREWHNLEDVDVVALQRWYDQHLPLEAVDPSTNVATVGHRPTHSWRLAGASYPDAHYYVENVFEALREPGEWYLDRGSGELWYVPQEDEAIGEVDVVAPRLRTLASVEGDPDAGEFVEFLRFEGLTFAHSAWEYAPPGYIQAASEQPGAITATGGRNLAFDDCTIAHVGMHGLELGPGCRSVRVAGCEFVDLGAGGVKIDGASVDDPRERRTGRVRVVDTHLHRGGRVFHRGVGLLAMHASDVDLSHNHVHDFFYSGVSCGWSWGYDEQVARDNRIAYNHVHDIGQGLLSDMGGVYTLGVQPGTVVRGNHVHGVEAWDYGGWGLYPDEGSSHLLVEDNVVHDTSHQLFHQHYGRENTVRNNVLASGAEGGLSLSRAEDHVSLTFERNVVAVDGQPAVVGGYGWSLEPGHLVSDLNLLWGGGDDEGEPHVGDPGQDDPELTLEAWRERGNDRHSVVADPALGAFEAPVRAAEAAADLGIEPVDPSEAGPRERPGANRPD